MRILTKQFGELRTGENYRNDLKSIIDKHCELIDVHHKLEDYYGFIVLWVAIGTAINLCIPAYQVVHVSTYLNLFNFNITRVRFLERFSQIT